METGDSLKKFAFSKKEWNRLKRLLENGKLSISSSSEKTPYWCSKLEKKVAERFDVKYAVSFNSCTSSIHAALGALNIKHSDQVIVSPLTCYSSILPVMSLGAVPIFCDVNKETLSIDWKKFRRAITSKTHAIILPYIYGLPADIKKIKRISERNEIKLIEDCAHVPGLKINNKYVGTFGNVGCFSFAQEKVLDCGEGGVATTKDKNIARELYFFKEGGKRGFRVYNPKGANYRMTEFNAFLAFYQLKNLKKNIKLRNSIANYYFSQKMPQGIRPANMTEGNVKSVALFETKEFSAEIINRLRKNGIYVKDIYKPLNESNVFQNQKLLARALQQDKENIRQYKKYSNETPCAKKASKNYFYIETNPYKKLSFHRREAAIFGKLLAKV